MFIGVNKTFFGWGAPDFKQRKYIKTNMSSNILIEFSARDISENVFLLVFLPSEELKTKRKSKRCFLLFFDKCSHY